MYGHVYVARVAFGAKMSQTVQAFLEAEAYPGTSLIIAYSHCIAHGYDMANGAIQQKLDAPRLWTAETARRRVHAQRVAVPRRGAHRSRALDTPQFRQPRCRIAGDGGRIPEPLTGDACLHTICL